MKDTCSKIEKQIGDLWMHRSGSERLIHGCAMFDDAKTMAQAGLQARYPRKNAEAIRQLLFLRLYGNDFAPEKLEKIRKVV